MRWRAWSPPAAIDTHTLRPDLAVILTCDPGELQRRLTVRGSPAGSKSDDTGTIVLDSTRHHADFLARQLTTAIQALRSRPRQ